MLLDSVPVSMSSTVTVMVEVVVSTLVLIPSFFELFIEIEPASLNLLLNPLLILAPTLYEMPSVLRLVDDDVPRLGRSF